ncbi:hypothetical protein [Sphingobacterium paramultivorum]|uniref:hypothetical protein n=1 Tax=Sphingobacterium paramultivorum TaxID=2886510 RepID=UPI00129D129B|nr:hypothetical protein [Sphingobacterium paramultivorum]
MDLTIGEIIAVDIKKSGLSVTHVAQKIGMSRKGLTDILKRNDMNLSQIASLSQELGRDYFEIFKLKENYNIPSSDTLTKIESIEKTNEIEKIEENQISFSIHLKGDFEKVSQEMSNFLQLVKKEAELRGFKLA